MKILKKELRSAIKSNFKRYLSIIIIIFLGVAFFVGMKINSSVLQNTMIRYYDKYNNWDIKVASPIGLTKSELNELKNEVPEIKQIEGKYYKEVISNLNNKLSNKHIDYPIAVHAYSDEYKINKVKIVKGREIKNDNECLVGTDFEKIGYKIGDKIKLDDEDLIIKEYKIVGFIQDPQYLTTDKATSTLTGGSIEYFLYINKDNFKVEKDMYMIFDIVIENKYKQFSEEHNKVLEKIKEKISKKSKKISKKREEEVIRIKTKELEEGEAKYNNEKALVEKELSEGKSKIDAAESLLLNAQMALMSDEEIDLYLRSLKEDLKSAKTQLDSSKEVLDIAKSILDNLPSVPAEAVNIDAVTLKQRYEEVRQKIISANNSLESLKKYLSEYRSKCSSLIVSSAVATCNQGAEVINSKIREQEINIEFLKEQAQILDEMIKNATNVAGSTSNSSLATENIEKAFDKYNKIREKYTNYVSEMENTYNSYLSKYNVAVKEYSNAERMLKTENNNARKTLESKKAELEQAKKEYEARKKEASNELEKAYSLIVEGKKLLKNIENFGWVVMSKNDTLGYGNYYIDAQKADDLSRIFPLIFFMVAALVTSTSITRLVQEEREKIGILKSLGYGKKKIILKYIKYSLSACIVGAILGIVFGTFVFPIIISKVYKIRYYIPELQFGFYPAEISLALLLSLISTVFVAFISAINVLNEKPAELLRPKVIHNARVDFIRKRKNLWRKQPFTKRTTYRSIFINIWRSIMSVLGVMGCTALIVAGFGARDSVREVISIQYNKIYNMDAEFYYKPSATQYDIKKDYEQVLKLDYIKSASIGKTEQLRIDKGKSITVTGIIPESSKAFMGNMNLYSVVTKKEISLSDLEGVVITEKVSKLLDINKGDKITFVDSSNVSHTTFVSDISENYFLNYMFMNKKTYEKLYGYELENNLLITKYTDNVVDESATSSIFARGNYSGYLSLNRHRKNNQELVDTLDKVLYLIIISAGLLAFVVLYNLAKINIGERLVEIATLKVFGYNAAKVNRYINYEITVLTKIGIVFGIVAGYYLTEIIVNSCELDFFMFPHEISYTSYIYGIILTLIFSKIINLMIRKDIRKISMTESLKAIE